MGQFYLPDENLAKVFTTPLLKIVWSDLLHFENLSRIMVFMAVKVFQLIL